MRGFRGVLRCRSRNGGDLSLSVISVNTHVHNIYAEFQARNRSQPGRGSGVQASDTEQAGEILLVGSAVSVHDSLVRSGLVHQRVEVRGEAPH